MPDSKPKATKRHTAAGWISIVFGILMCCGGTMGAAGYAAQMSGAMQEFQESAAGGDATQLEIQRNVQEVTDGWMPVTVPLTLLRLLISVLVILGGWLLINGHARATAVALAGLGLALLVDAALGGVGAIVGYQTVEIMNESMSGLIGGMGGAEQEVFLKTMKGAQYAGLAMGLAWTLLKLGLLAVCILLVLRPGELAEPLPGDA